MKKMTAVLLLFLLLPIFAAAEEKAQYEAVSSRDTYLVESPGGRSLAPIPDRSKLQVLEAGEEWSRVYFEEQTGYCKTKYLYHFLSLDPFDCQVPGMQRVTGFASFNAVGHIAGDKFNGMDVKPGQVFCVEKEEGETYRVPVWRGETQVHRAEVTYYPFADWQTAASGDVIGGFTTFYGDQQGKGRAREREHNIVLGCERINETVVKVDGYFSFNDLCAPYSQNNGYQYAPNISNDGFGYGGGVCQLTTTLYNAVLQLPLQVDEWALHRYTGIQYAPQFFDAAVGSYSDFTFQNTLPYAIRILAVPQDGVLTVLILRD